MRPMSTASLDGIGVVAWVAVAVCLCLAVTSAQAQFVQPGAAMPPATLDVDGPFRFVPHPPLLERDQLARAQVRLYGRLAIGGILDRGASNEPDAQKRRFQIGSRTRSFVGLAATDLLDGGWFSNVQLEHSLDVDSGTGRCIPEKAGCATDPGPSEGTLGPPERAGRFWHGRSTVGIGHRELGQLDLGRLAQPAWLVALALDPWSGNTSASPRERLYQAPADSRVGSMERPETRVRSDNSATFTSRPDVFWRWSLQTASTEDEPTAATHGFSISYQRGSWYAGGGGQRWKDGSFALPMGVVYDTGQTRYFGAATLGRLGQGQYRTVFGAISHDFMSKGETTRHTVQAGVSRMWSDSLEDGPKVGVGYRYRLSLRTSVELTASLERARGGNARTVEAGLVHLFSRDLRFPQQGFR